MARLLDGSEDLRALELNVVSAVDGYGGDQFVGIALAQVSGRLVPAARPENVPAD